MGSPFLCNDRMVPTVTFFLFAGRGLPMGEWELWRTCHDAASTGMPLHDEACVVVNDGAGRVSRPRTEAHDLRRTLEVFIVLS